MDIKRMCEISKAHTKKFFLFFTHSKWIFLRLWLRSSLRKHRKRRTKKQQPPVAFREWHAQRNHSLNHLKIPSKIYFILVSKYPHVVCHFAVPLGSMEEVPAASCQEIKTSEGPSTVSGNYWLDSIKPGQVTLVFCDMRTGGEFLWCIRKLYEFDLWLFRKLFHLLLSTLLACGLRKVVSSKMWIKTYRKLTGHIS